MCVLDGSTLQGLHEYSVSVSLSLDVCLSPPRAHIVLQDRGMDRGE
jgi:hypothetical protein